MGKNKQFTSLESATSSGPGEARKTAGHPHLGLFVIARNLDTANDTLEVRGEVSPDDDEYAQVDIGTTGQDDALSVSTSDFEDQDGDGTYAAFVTAHNVPVEYVRANITNFTDSADGDLEVDVYVYLTGWTGHGKSYNERTDFA